MTKRRGVLILAILLGILGSTAVYLYAHKSSTESTQAQSVTVLSAKAAIPAGTPVAVAQQKGLIVPQQLPANVVPTGALSNLDSVANLVAAHDIAPQQVLLAQLFAPQALTGPLPIPKGQMALTVNIAGSVERVGGYVTPGTDVAIFNVYTPPGSKDQRTRLLVPKTQVLAVGATTITNTQAGADPAVSMMTLALSQADAERVIQATLSGKLYFGLLNPQTTPTRDAGTGDAELFQ